MTDIERIEELILDGVLTDTDISNIIYALTMRIRVVRRDYLWGIKLEDLEATNEAQACLISLKDTKSKFQKALHDLQGR